MNSYGNGRVVPSKRWPRIEIRDALLSLPLR